MASVSDVVTVLKAATTALGELHRKLAEPSKAVKGLRELAPMAGALSALLAALEQAARSADSQPGGATASGASGATASAAVAKLSSQLQAQVQAALSQIGLVEKKYAASSGLQRALRFGNGRGLVEAAREAEGALRGVKDAAQLLVETEKLRVQQCDLDMKMQRRDDERAAMVGEWEKEYGSDIRPIMDRLGKQEREMGAAYPEAGFLDPGTYEQMNKDMVALATFWRRVQAAHKAGTIDDAWWAGHRSWLGRGREYRLLGEPLDIVNWYYKSKHIKHGKHYAADIAADPVAAGGAGCGGPEYDNSSRPGRYILLQRLEREILGKVPEPSLGKARELEAKLGLTLTLQQATEGAGGAAPGGGGGQPSTGA